MIWKKAKIHPVIFSLLIITIYPLIAYFLFIPFLGFYNDDWLFAYIGQFYKTQGLLKAFIGDRPVVGYLFALNNILMGNNLILWHIYMFLMRLLGGYALFFLLKKIWPNRLSIITSITILFLIYPGFLQQIGPLGYQNYITALTLWVISLLFTVEAIKKHSKIVYVILTLIALVLQLSSFLLLEFFIGMEILRFLLVTYILRTEINYNQLKKRFISWSPYIFSLLIFLVWRIFIFKSTREATNINWVTQTYYSNPLWIAKIPFKIVYSWISGILLAYFIPIIVRLSRLPVEVSLACLSLGVISSSLLYPYYKMIEKSEHDNSSDHVNVKKLGKILLLIGSISVLIALIPIIISGRFASVFLYNDNYDRYTISSIIGIAFIYVGILLWKTSSKIYTRVMILLVTISIITQLINGYWHSIYWNNQKETWWQIYWRAPQIQQNTLLIFDFPKVTDKHDITDKTINLYQTTRLEDYQIWAPGNLFFNYHNSPINHFGGQYLTSEGTTQKIRNKVIENITEENGAVTFTKDFNNIIIISLPTDKSCLWVLDKDKLELPDAPSELLRSNTAYSNVGRLIQKDTTQPPSQIFGVEPPRSWCYYFQKASLARQWKDWDVLSHLTDAVREKNLKPKDVNEWLPFIEGLIISEKYQQADDLIKNALQEEPNQKTLRDNICKMAKRLTRTELEYYCNSDNLKT